MADTTETRNTVENHTAPMMKVIIDNLIVNFDQMKNKETDSGLKTFFKMNVIDLIDFDFD